MGMICSHTSTFFFSSHFHTYLHYSCLGPHKVSACVFPILHPRIEYATSRGPELICVRVGVSVYTHLCGLLGPVLLFGSTFFVSWDSSVCVCVCVCVCVSTVLALASVLRTDRSRRAVTDPWWKSNSLCDTAVTGPLKSISLHRAS